MKDQFTFDNFLLTIKKYENSTGEKIFQYDSLSDESNVSPISESDNIVIDKSYREDKSNSIKELFERNIKFT